jgi:tRNA1(Val) A37 N6-methylase TrmN6
MQEGALETWVRFLATVAAPKGRITLIHLPQILPELLPLLARRFGAITLFPLFPKEASRRSASLCRRKKEPRRLRLLSGLVLHELAAATQTRPRSYCERARRSSFETRSGTPKADIGHAFCGNTCHGNDGSTLDS